MDDSRSNNDEVLVAHRDGFYHALDEHYKGKDASHVLIKSKSNYENIIDFLTGPAPKDKNIKKTKSEYYAMSHYER